MLMIMLNQLFRLKHPSIDRWLPTYCSYCYEDMCLEAGVLLLSNQSRTVCLLTIAEKSQTKPTPNGAKQIDYTVVWPYIRRVTWYWTELETILEANNNETMLSLPMYIYIYIYIYIIYTCVIQQVNRVGKHHAQQLGRPVILYRCRLVIGDQWSVIFDGQLVRW